MCVYIYTYIYLERESQVVLKNLPANAGDIRDWI